MGALHRCVARRVRWLDLLVANRAQHASSFQLYQVTIYLWWGVLLGFSPTTAGGWPVVGALNF